MPKDWISLFPVILLAVVITGNDPSAEGKKQGSCPAAKADRGIKGFSFGAKKDKDIERLDKKIKTAKLYNE